MIRAYMSAGMHIRHCHKKKSSDSPIRPSGLEGKALLHTFRTEANRGLRGKVRPMRLLGQLGLAGLRAARAVTLAPSHPIIAFLQHVAKLDHALLCF